MKKIYSFLLIFILSSFQSQVVNIPDVNFKAKLISTSTTNYIAQNSFGQSIKIDTNNNGEVEASEINAITKLNVSNANISNLTGINSFTALKELLVSGNTLTAGNFSLPLLQVLDVSGNNLSSIDLGGYPALINLTLTNNSISSLVLNHTALQFLTVGGSNLINLNIQGLTGLKKLYVNYSTIETITALNMPNLMEVNINNAPSLTQVDFSGSNSLKTINMQQSSINNLVLTNLLGLQTIQFNNNNIPNLNLSGCSALSFVSAASCNISNINLNNTPALASLNLSQNNLSTLALDPHYSLTYLECEYNDLTALSLNNTPNILYLYVSSNQLTSLNLAPTTQITTLKVSYNQLTSINVSMLSNLHSLRCTNNLFTELDLSSNTNLQSIDCQSNANLTRLFLKNGSSQAVNNTYLFPNPSLQYICCDDNEVNYFNNYNNAYNNNSVINSYCSFTPGGSFYTIQGNTKYDNNNNGCDVNDLNKDFQKFTVTNGSTSGTIIANNSGDYTIPVQAGSHTITPILENPTYFNISPASFTASFPSQTNPLTQNFCLTANGNHNDLEVLIIPTTPAAPGFNAKYKIVYKNKGTTTQSGTLIFNYDDNLMDYLSSTSSPGSQSTGNINWTFANLAPMESRQITLTFLLNTPTQTPPLSSGNTLIFNSQINGLADETPSDNSFTLNQIVVNSFDPNDKTCLEGTSITQANVGDYVHYLIRFENTGTANAQNIVVKDIIDTNKYDINSLVAMNASHSFVTRITSPNIVEFIFQNIQLPFNDATNDGYVLFKIKTKSTLNIGDSFSNTANIYFDYNHPITTNTYTTMVSSNLATEESIVEKNTVSIYPNPVRDILHIKSKNEIIKVEIFDAAGRIILSTKVNGNSIHVSELSKGSYMIKLFGKQNSEVHQFIKL